MAIFRRHIHNHEKTNWNENWFYLARNSDTGDVFVEHTRIDPKGGTDTRQIPLDKFLSTENNGSARSKLLALIGDLVGDRNDA